MREGVCRLYEVFESSPQMAINDASRIVIMSDCHRGDGNWSDTFAQNQNICFRALQHYFDKNFTYIELGDGDELWKNKRMQAIKEQHSNIFWILSRFYAAGRLRMLYGNHDMVKKYPSFRKSMEEFYDERKHRTTELFPGINVTEGLVLRYRGMARSIFLVHGHQGDAINDKWWRLGRFLVRSVWRHLEQFGVNDPTMAAKNYNKKAETEQRLMNWSEESGHIVISGHTHRPVFPMPDEPHYFNAGSCVHPRCITAIEIAGGFVTLVKWFVNTREDGTLFIDREELAGPKRLIEYLRYS